MCINQFYPIQPGSFWSLQMLFISLPIMLYMVYVRNVSAHVRIVRVKMSHATEVEKKAWKRIEEDR